MVIFIFFVAIWYLSLFFQTFFQHRYAAHGAFTMSKGWEKFFFILTYITQGSSYMSPRAYAIMHRLHHAHTDTELDPHSPSNSSNIFKMMWSTRTAYQGILQNKTEVDSKYTKNVPSWAGFDKFANSTFSRLMWVAAYVLFFAVFATSAWQYLLLPIVVSMGAFHGAIVNWFAHKYGYINFRLRNTAMNLLFVDVLMLGESYHNNHHKHPSSINFGKRWFEIDPSYYIIKLLAFLRIIKLVNLPKTQLAVA
ncbi:stearoyl-CoA desaturase (delta-9 desaturase) [Chitinophaga jiangningensis]|uniref:Stearoyl-CoA desaturase (Delta-9 desaturase) n=1 Tax=Chitinophaga jiangningensis TaxID=1419482 RepID=A0A1M7KIS0_9BACT|nr:acyl-CoA desaturase [Chitinophaga jiangningensis]SHM65150.1 stearoyl-CoA desaturase (delta-9 desaturase) [Chitinophaga jiangningensis]